MSVNQMPQQTPVAVESWHAHLDSANALRRKTLGLHLRWRGVGHRHDGLVAICRPLDGMAVPAVLRGSGACHRRRSHPTVATGLPCAQQVAARDPPLGACLSILRGRDRGRFRFSRGGADVVGSRPNEEATTMDEAKSARSLWVGWERGVCGVARLGRSTHYVPRRAPCIRSLSQPTRLTQNTQTGS